MGIVVGVRADAATEIVEVNFAGSVGLKRLDLSFTTLARITDDAQPKP
jgi:hypothetical protein